MKKANKTPDHPRYDECYEKIHSLLKEYGMELILQCIINRTIWLHDPSKDETYMNRLIWDLKDVLNHYQDRYEED